MFLLFFEKYFKTGLSLRNIVVLWVTTPDNGKRFIMALLQRASMRTLCVRHIIYEQDGHTMSTYRAPTHSLQKRLL
jgi:hypothetical protein